MSHHRSIFYALFSLFMGVWFCSCDRAASDKVPSTTEEESPRIESEAALSATPPTTDAGTGVLVWVNGDAVEETDLTRHIERLESMYGAQRRPLQGAERVLKRRLVTEKLIDRRLLDQWIAEHERPPVPATDVDRALAQRIRDSFGSREVLERHLERRGETLGEYKKELRDRLVLERLLSGLSGPGDAKAATVESKFEEVVARPTHAIRVRAAALLVRWPDGVDRDAVRDEVVASVSSADSLNAFKVACSRLGEKWQTRFERDTGWLELGQTAADIEKTLFHTEPGHVTEAIVTPLGVQLFFVHERQKTETEELEALRPVIEKRLEEERFLERKQALIDRLRKDAVIRWNNDNKPGATP